MQPVRGRFSEPLPLSRRRLELPDPGASACYLPLRCLWQQGAPARWTLAPHSPVTGPMRLPQMQPVLGCAGPRSWRVACSTCLRISLVHWASLAPCWWRQRSNRGQTETGACVGCCGMKVGNQFAQWRASMAGASQRRACCSPAPPPAGSSPRASTGQPAVPRQQPPRNIRGGSTTAAIGLCTRGVSRWRLSCCTPSAICSGSPGPAGAPVPLRTPPPAGAGPTRCAALAGGTLVAPPAGAGSMGRYGSGAVAADVPRCALPEQPGTLAQHACLPSLQQTAKPDPATPPPFRRPHRPRPPPPGRAFTCQLPKVQEV